MPRLRRIDKLRPRIEIPDFLWRWLADEPVTDRDDFFDVFLIGGSPDHSYDDHLSERLRMFWEQTRDYVMEAWHRPGVRPALWWTFSAPRLSCGKWPACYWDGLLPEPRKQISGAGQPAWEVLNLVPYYEYGVPASWTGLDAADPPLFQSQADYLAERGLLDAGEQKQLSEEDFKPEIVTPRFHYDRLGRSVQ